MPRQYFFWKYFNTIIVLYCIIVQKSPIFVQLSPIQCTYSNIFIRFFKFFPANTNIYQNSYRVIGVLCGLRHGVLSSQCGHLILIRYEVLNVITMRCPYLIRYEVPCHCERSVAISRKGNLVIKPTQYTFVLAWGKGAHKQKSERYRLR